MAQPKSFRFVTRAIEQLPAHDPESRSRCAEYTDTQIPGFKLQVTTQGRKYWYYRYTFGGTKRAYKIGEFPATTLEAARQRCLEMRAQLDRGIDPQEERDRLKAMPTFEEFAKYEYQPFVDQYKRSADDDEAKLRLYLVPAFGRRRLCDITTRDIQMYLVERRKKLSPATCNRHFALLSRLFKLAVQWGRIDRNPCLGITKLKENGQKQHFLSPEDVRSLMQAADTESNLYASAAIRMLLLTGCRREEILQARWEHVDLVGGTLYLPKTKSGRSRYVVLNDAALDLLKSLPKIETSPWVFPGRDPAKPLNNPRKAFLRMLKVAGLEACRIHDLRHSHASLLVNQGVSLYQVQHILGHASPQTTTRYAHLANNTLREASQIVGRIATQQ